MAGWEHEVCDANDLLLDRLIHDCNEQPVGMVDDLELTVPDDGGAPVLSALLCGPTALGPRIGARVGTWWLAIGRRLRPNDDPYPVRIPMDVVDTIDRKHVMLRIQRDAAGTARLREWMNDKLVGRIPGGNR